MKILHLVPDEKFILFFSDLFGQLEGVENRYLVQADPLAAFSHVKGLDVWRTVGRSYFSSPEMANDLAWADCLIVHFLDVNGARMVLNAPPRVLTVWSGWGGDYYSLLPGGERLLLGEETRELFDNLRSSHRMTARQRSWALVRSAKHQVLKSTVLIPALRRMDYFSAPIKGDFFRLKKTFGHRFSAEYLQLNYGSVEKTFLAGGERRYGSDILIGNSATPTNNHLEAFTLLAAQDLGDRKLIVPLSYGLPQYRDAIVARGHAIFGNRFVPVCDYMPLTEYNDLISQCSIVIMNHRRQQALGNIGAMLHRGAKIFLDSTAPLYSYFKERGAYVFPVTDIVADNERIFDLLPEQQAAINAKVLETEWGHARVMSNARDFVSELTKRIRRA